MSIYIYMVHLAPPIIRYLFGVDPFETRHVFSTCVRVLKHPSLAPHPRLILTPSTYDVRKNSTWKVSEQAVLDENKHYNK